MLQKPLCANSHRKQTAVFLVACVTATCAILVMGVLRSSKAQDSLQKYSDIASLSAEKRRAAFINASSKDKSDFFRTHLALYLARHSQLSENQTKTILDGISLATPELYELRPDSPGWEEKFQAPMMEFQNRILAAFPKGEAAILFATPGNQPPQDDSLQKYRNLISLTMPLRKTGFRRASPNDKNELWRIHLALYLAHHPELSTEQSKAIVDALAFLTPALFEESSDSRVWETRAWIKVFEGRVRAVFSTDVGAKIFATLGDLDSPRASSTARPFGMIRPAGWKDDTYLGPRETILARFVETLPQDFLPDCSCNCYDSDWCSSKSHCSCGQCNEGSWGCGLFWAYPCNGRCVLNSIE